MKKFLFSLLTFSSLLVASQIPQSFNYQAVARNVNGTVIANQFISVEISIRDGSPTANIVYQEIDTATTNQFGLFTVAIGTGQVQVGTNLPAINWATGNKYLEVGFSQTGGNTFTPMGTTELLSVPYALYSANSGSYTGNTWLDYAVYSETESTGASSQTSFTDSAWQTRVLNITEDSAGTAISRNGNEITLQPGEYHVSAFAQWGITATSIIEDQEIGTLYGNSLLRLVDNSNNVYLTGQGEYEYPQYAVSDPNPINGVYYYVITSYSANIEGVITITTATSLSLQHYIRYLDYGFSNAITITPVGGIPMGIGQNEVYARILIQKVN